MLTADGIPSDGGVSVLFVGGWLRVGGDSARVEVGHGVLVNKVCVRVYMSQQVIFTWAPDGEEHKEDPDCDVFHFDNSVYLRIGPGFTQVRYLEIHGRQLPRILHLEPED